MFGLLVFSPSLTRVLSAPSDIGIKIWILPRPPCSRRKTWTEKVVRVVEDFEGRRQKKKSGRNITSWKFGLVILKKISMVGANCAFRGVLFRPRKLFGKVKGIVLITPTTGHWQRGNEVCFWRPSGSAIRWCLREVIFLEIWGFVNLPRLF